MKTALFTCACGSTSWLSYAKITVQSLIENRGTSDVFMFTNPRGFKGVDNASIKIGGASVVILDATIEDFGGGSGHPEDGCCIRLKAFEYLADQGYDMAVYFDADAILIRPFPDEFWNGRNGMVADDIMRAALGKSKDISLLQNEGKRIAYEHGEYFNSGMVRADLHDPIWRGLHDRYMEYRLLPRENGALFDQPFLNEQFLHVDREYLHFGYNFHAWLSEFTDLGGQVWKCKNFTKEEGPSVLKKTVDNVYVIHYAWTKKPWHAFIPGNITSTMNLGIYWFELAMRTPGIDEAIRDKAKENAKLYKEDVVDNLDVEPLPLPSRHIRKVKPVTATLDSLFEI